MLKKMTIAAIAALSVSAAQAKEIQISITDQEQQNWVGGVMPAFNQCVAALSIKKDGSTACGALGDFLQAFAEKVAKAKQAADVPPPAPAPAPAPEPPK